MDKPQNHHVEQRRTETKEYRNLYIGIYVKFKKKAKLNYDDRNQNSDRDDDGVSAGEWKRQEDKFWNVGNVYTFLKVFTRVRVIVNIHQKEHL